MLGVPARAETIADLDRGNLMSGFVGKESRSGHANTVATAAAPAVGKTTLVAQVYAPGSAVQRSQASGGSDAQVDELAAKGASTPASPLPHHDRLQRVFGRPDVSAVQAEAGAPDEGTKSVQTKRDEGALADEGPFTMKFLDQTTTFAPVSGPRPAASIEDPGSSPEPPSPQMVAPGDGAPQPMGIIIPGDNAPIDKADSLMSYDTKISYAVYKGDNPAPSGTPIREKWTTEVVADYPGSDWARGNEMNGRTQDNLFVDHITGDLQGRTPQPQAPQSPRSSVKTVHWGQDFYVGNDTRPALSHTLQKYTDHARHEKK
jgi:hypothetical protein